MTKITNPAKFSNPDVVFKLDNAWLNTTLAAMGCTGLIYSYILHVVPTFYGSELPTIDTWKNLKDGLLDGSASKHSQPTAATSLRSIHMQQLIFRLAFGPPTPIPLKPTLLAIVESNTALLASIPWIEKILV